MTRYQPLWQQSGSYQAQQDRSLLTALWPSGGATGAAVTVVSNTMNVSVAAGQAAVPLTGFATALCTWDAAEVVTLAAAPPSGQNRQDLIVVQYRDNALDSGGNNDFILTSVTGTPAAPASAVPPPVPANAFAVAQVAVVGAAANLNGATIYDLRLPILSLLDAAEPLARLRGSGTYSTTSQTYVIINSALHLDFVAPPSGIVKFVLAGLWNSGATGVRCNVGWSSGSAAGAGFMTGSSQTGSIDNTQHRHQIWYSSALTPGKWYSMYPQWAVYNVAGTAQLGGAGNETILEAWAAY